MACGGGSLPDDIRAALGRLGLAEEGADLRVAGAYRAGSRPTSGRSRPADEPSASSAPSPGSRSPPTGRRRSGATPSKPPGSRPPARIVPDAVPRLLGHDPEAGLIAMDYLDPGEFLLWKEKLRRGQAEADDARGVVAALAAIHAATAGRDDIARRFASDAIFHAIRLEPYLETAARAHPDLAPALDFDRTETNGGDTARPSPRRREPQEHPDRARTGRCFSTPNAPGTAIPPSTSPSASTTCCSSACGRRRPRRGSWAASTFWRRPISTASSWEPPRCAGIPRGAASRRAVPRARRRQVAGRVRDGGEPTRTAFAASHARCWKNRRAGWTGSARRGRRSSARERDDDPLGACPPGVGFASATDRGGRGCACGRRARPGDRARRRLAGKRRGGGPPGRRGRVRRVRGGRAPPPP